MIGGAAEQQAHQGVWTLVVCAQEEGHRSLLLDLAGLCGAACAPEPLRLDHLLPARMVREGDFRHAVGVLVGDIRLLHLAIPVQKLPAPSELIWRADDRYRLLAACVLAPGVFCRLARTQPQRTTPARNWAFLALSHARQREEGRQRLLAGRMEQQAVFSYGRAPFQMMARTRGCVAQMRSRAALERAFLTTHQYLQVGGLEVVGHQQEAEDAAIRHLVPTHPRVVEAGGQTALPGSQGH